MALTSEEIRFMRWRGEEALVLADPPYKKKSIIFDLRRTILSASTRLNRIVPSKLGERIELPRLVVSDEALSLVESTFQPKEVLTKMEEAFSDLAFELRSYRYDKGINYPRNREIQHLKINSLSLDISEIQFRPYTWKYDDRPLRYGYVIFEGKYRHGSAGKDDALFIQWRLTQFCEAVEPSCLVVDLRQLEYEWGDDIHPYPSGVNFNEIPIRFLLRSEQIPNYSYAIDSPSEIYLDEAEIVRELRHS
jgi:hypothetical protein